MSGKGETMDGMGFKFGQNIHRVHPNKSPLKILASGVSRDCPNFFGYPHLSQEWVKLWTSNFARPGV